MKIPQLDIGKQPHEPVNMRMNLYYPADTPFGNLTLAEFEVFERVDYLNVCVRNLYATWWAFVPNLSGSIPPEVMRLRLQTEDIIYSLRKLIDTLISLSCILGERVAGTTYPKRIRVDSIAALLKKLDHKSPAPDWVECYRAHREFLTVLNDVSNTYKHHLVNCETHPMVPTAEPTAFFLSMPQNDSEKKPRLQSVRLSVLFGLADRFLAEARKDHRRLIFKIPQRIAPPPSVTPGMQREDGKPEQPKTPGTDI